MLSPIPKMSEGAIMLAPPDPWTAELAALRKLWTITLAQEFVPVEF